MVLFVLVWTLLAAINHTPCFIWVVCNKLTTVWASAKKCSLTEFSGPYSVTKYGSGWRKDVVNQCLEFVSDTHRDMRTVTDTQENSHWHRQTEEQTQWLQYTPPNFVTGGVLNMGSEQHPTVHSSLTCVKNCPGHHSRKKNKTFMSKTVWQEIIHTM